MAYVKKIINADEELIGIARLHWIYVLRGLFWFLVLAGGGWLFDLLITKAAMAIASSMNSAVIPAILTKMSSGVMFFLMAGGFMMFALMVVKVLVEEVGMTSRRVIHKTGLMFVKVHQIDHEEIRGENLDLGYFGRVLGYGYLMLDCRFVGDVRLPAIENPERFIRALHEVRATTQDAISIMVGKNAAVVPLDVQKDGEQDQDKSKKSEEGQKPEAPRPETPKPEIEPGKPGPQPEVQPDEGRPEVQPQPTPHNPPPAPEAPPQPEQPSQPQQPVEAPPPSEPPLQPPSNVTLPSQVAAQQPAAPAVDPNAMAEMMKQMMPQMAEQVAKQLAAEGLVAKKANPPAQASESDDKNLDTDLIASFGEASREGDANGLRNKVEHAIH